MDHVTQFILPWTELIDRSALVISMSFCEHGNEPSNSRLAKELLDSEEGICFVELVIISMPNLKINGFHSSIILQTGISMQSSRNRHLVFLNRKHEKKKSCTLFEFLLPYCLSGL